MAIRRTVAASFVEMEKRCSFGTDAQTHKHILFFDNQEGLQSRAETIHPRLQGIQ